MAPRGGCEEGMSLPTGNNSGEGGYAYPHICLILAQKAEFWCILGLINPLLIGVMYRFFGQHQSRGDRLPLAPPPWIRPCAIPWMTHHP